MPRISLSNRLRHGGETIRKALHQHRLKWVSAGIVLGSIVPIYYGLRSDDGDPPLQPALPQLEHRVVTESGQRFFEVGFTASEVLTGDASTGFQDPKGNAFFDIEYSNDLANWARLKFHPAPDSVTENGDGTYTYWSRAENPVNADEKTGALVVDMVNGDPRNSPITGITLAGDVLTLPNFPYDMPDDAAQLEADLLADGWTGSTVTAESASRWSISIPDVEYTSSALTSRVHWESYESGTDPIFGTPLYSSGIGFYGRFVTGDGTPIYPAAFARLRAIPGWRYGAGEPDAPAFWLPPEYVPPSLGGSGGGGTPSTPAPPVLASAAPPISGSHAPGASLAKPTYSWASPGGSAISIVGRWWKNGVDTGSDAATFSDTADGDVIEYREVATNSEGSSDYDSWQGFAVSAQVAALATESKPAVSALLDGLPGGSANMEVFSSLDHDTKSYTRNTDLWAASLVEDGLAAAVVYKPVRSKASYGGVLITPRHVLYCEHAHPHAANTWMVNTSDSTPQLLRWVLADNTLVEVEQVSQTTRNASGYGYYNPGFHLDLCVATLNEDAEALGVPVVPIMRIRSTAETNALVGIDYRVLNVSQGIGRATSVVAPTPASAYDQYHHSLVGVGPRIQTEAPFNLFSYDEWDGDSGTPVFVLHRGGLYLESIMVGHGWARVRAGRYIAEINAMIAAADADAVARGKIAEPTGLTVTGTLLPVD